ncbi:2,3-diaminopropionate biosynthesis protein SbnB [Paenibacillus montanisoli]|uniref:2,3-diaminopropionate biosynthesis protein SbnB n=1 Tax=Paenibacillus montanisoli TaxID=2081970 RepID=A0A328U403_9BACL|nr:2,3-diaminopropionate biosynthesis protein SbnB [Paenibacillus montanisoli]RAP74724.1 2,3-diaminopropionate biosynthesis protein SbnB [Paenibacillus montanisoli]
MIYLHDGHIRDMGMDWRQLTGIVEQVIRTRDAGDTVSPLKTYLRFHDLKNRIIAMPSFVGGSFGLAGLKWIASYPDNGRHGLPRAHNTIILNDTATGRPVALLRSELLNGLRTAAVSGLMMQAYMAARQPEELRLGIIGWGPIGRRHLEMCAALFGNRLKQVMLNDLKGIDPDTIPLQLRDRTEIAADWRAVYRGSNVTATCTVAAERYIDEQPPAGALLLNVSLRDYKPASVAKVNAVIVDDWREVCRENTDIEKLHEQAGLSESDARTIADVVCRGAMAEFAADEAVFFNPMGLGAFDIAIAGYYWQRALQLGLGVELEQDN